MAGWWKSDFTLPNGKKSFSEIWAENREEAEQIADRRGFRNVRRTYKPVKEFRPSVIAAEKGLSHSALLHAVCYVAFLAVRSGTVTAEQLVGDDGPLHELGHFLDGGENIRGGNMKDRVIERLRWLESLTPGLPPI